MPPRAAIEFRLSLVLSNRASIFDLSLSSRISNVRGNYDGFKLIWDVFRFFQEEYHDDSDYALKYC
jgi:hypothetical protein